MASRAAEVTKECKRQYENCLYSSTSLFIWLRALRTTRLLFATLPLLFSGIATWKFLSQTEDPHAKIVIAVCTLLAGLLPMMAAALKLEKQIEQVSAAATEFNNLRDRFRQAAMIASKRQVDAFEAEFQRLMTRMEAVRKVGLTPPELVFKLAQRKVASGDYSFDLDLPDEKPVETLKGKAEAAKTAPAFRVAEPEEGEQALDASAEEDAEEQGTGRQKR